MICLINYGEAQSNRDIRNNSFDPQKDEIVSRSIMKLVQRDLELFRLEKIENKKLISRLDSISAECTNIINEVSMALKKQEIEKKSLLNINLHLVESVEKEKGRSRNYKALFDKKSNEVLKLSKYKGMAMLKFGELIIVETLFVLVIVGVLKISK